MTVNEKRIYNIGTAEVIMLVKDVSALGGFSISSGDGSAGIALPANFGSIMSSITNETSLGIGLTVIKP